KSQAMSVKLEKRGEAMRLVLPASKVPPNPVLISVYPDFLRAKIGDDGYYVLPDGMLGAFKERDLDGKKAGYILSRQMPIALSCFKKGNTAYAAVVSGMRYDCRTRVKLENGEYAMWFDFQLKNLPVYEDIVIDFYKLEGESANYSAAGRLYRKLKLESGEVKPIKERANAELAYAAKYPEIRVRQAWKPYPSPVEEQTEETEPPLNVKATFDRVGEILDELKAQGVGGAQICLVGWNKSGHDGRWPQSFPVEPKLGGEAKLRGLIKKAQSMGYQIVCHSNAVGGCSIANTFSFDMVSRDQYGNLRKSNVWSGGRYYRLCPKEYHEKLSRENIERIASLGFRGLHYIDVISTVRPAGCYNPKHPTNAKTSGQYWESELADAAKLMGGAASEGGFDYVAGHLDYGLYITFNLKKIPPMADRYVPIWHIVYNGIILSNAATDTMNYSIKPKEDVMKVVEFATRPTFYFYSAFSSNPTGNWMGNTDLYCGTGEELKKSVSAIKEGYELMRKIGRLQLEFFEEHSELAPGVFLSRFGDGTEIVCNYSDKTFKRGSAEIAPLSYRVFDPPKKRRGIRKYRSHWAG
ncbi:MAG: hypothetical protein IJI37_08105, partial [Opitutales bacterium]|nr:hypothetical protein [Opitutales bacterium]